MTGDNRFKKARCELNQHGKQSVKQVSQNTGIPASLINDLEANTSTPRQTSYLKVATLAKYYGVSTDWLSGNCEIPSIDITVAKICEVTGLDEKIVEYFIESNRKDYEQNDFDPILIFDGLFSPLTLKALLFAVHAYLINKSVLFDVKSKITYEREHATAPDGGWLRIERAKDLRHELLEAQRGVRYARFETIDMFTDLFDSVMNTQELDGEMDSLIDLFKNVPFDEDSEEV